MPPGPKPAQAKQPAAGSTPSAPIMALQALPLVCAPPILHHDLSAPAIAQWLAHALWLPVENLQAFSKSELSAHYFWILAGLRRRPP